MGSNPTSAHTEKQALEWATSPHTTKQHNRDTTWDHGQDSASPQERSCHHQMNRHELNKTKPSQREDLTTLHSQIHKSHSSVLLLEAVCYLPNQANIEADLKINVRLVPDLRRRPTDASSKSASSQVTSVVTWDLHQQTQRRWPFQPRKQALDWATSPTQQSNTTERHNLGSWSRLCISRGEVAITKWTDISLTKQNLPKEKTWPHFTLKYLSLTPQCYCWKQLATSPIKQT